MKATAKCLQAAEPTIRYMVHKNNICQSYMMEERAVYVWQDPESRVIWSKCSLNKLEHPEKPDMLWFF